MKVKKGENLYSVRTFRDHKFETHWIQCTHIFIYSKFVSVTN